MDKAPPKLNKAESLRQMLITPQLSLDPKDKNTNRFTGEIDQIWENAKQN